MKNHKLNKTNMTSITKSRRWEKISKWDRSDRPKIPPSREITSTMSREKINFWSNSNLMQYQLLSKTFPNAMWRSSEGDLSFERTRWKTGPYEYGKEEEHIAFLQMKNQDYKSIEHVRKNRRKKIYSSWFKQNLNLGKMSGVTLASVPKKNKDWT